MGKGRGPAACCCGACSCGICCAVFILLAGVITWACVWGIEYNPNVNVKTLDLDLREIRVNIYNRNLYATEFSEFDLRLEAKAGNKIKIGGSYKTSSSVNVKPQTGKRRTLTREGTETLIELDPDDYAKLMEKCDEKGRLKVKLKGHLKQRRARSGEAKTKTRVISQWENVNCAEVFSTGCTTCLEGSPSPTGPCQQSNGLCWALDGGVCPTGTTLC